MMFLLGGMSGESLEKQGRVRRAPRAIITQSLRDRRRDTVARAGEAITGLQRTQRLRSPWRRGYHAVQDRRYDSGASKEESRCALR